MRISDWSSDVCSSDLVAEPGVARVDLLAAVVDAVIELHDQRRGFGGSGALIALLDELVLDVGCILREFEAARAGGVARFAAEALARRRRKALDTGDVERKRVEEGQRGSVRVDN